MSIEEEEDASLKELVTKTLHSNGVLGKIQAQLRASVFLALEDEFRDKNIPLVSASAKKLLSTSEGATAAALVQDFLQCLGLDFSLAVFAPESGHSTTWTFPGTEALSSSLSINAEKGHKTPLLIELLRERQSSILSHVENKNNQVKPSLNNNKGHSQLSLLNGIAPQPHPPHGSSELFKAQPELSLLNLEREGSESSQSSSRTEAESKSGLSKSEYKDFPRDTELNTEADYGKNADGLPLKQTSQDDNIGSECHQTNQKIGVGSNSSLGTSDRFPVLPPMEEKNLDTHGTLAGEEKQYEDDFSSMSDKEDHDDDDDDDVEEEEECVEEAEDIDEDISIDDLINSSASIGSDQTKDQSLSQASDVVNYQEDL